MINDLGLVLCFLCNLPTTLKETKMDFRNFGLVDYKYRTEIDTTLFLFDFCEIIALNNAILLAGSFRMVLHGQ